MAKRPQAGQADDNQEAEGARAPGTVTRLTENARGEPALRTERADIRTGTEAAADDKREESERTYHVLRRHDAGAVEYDTADAIARGGPTAAHRQSTRTMRASDAADLVRLGVLSEDAPGPAKVVPSSMVSGGRALEQAGGGPVQEKADQ